MPEMNGDEATKKVNLFYKRLRIWSKIKTIRIV